MIKLQDSYWQPIYEQMADYFFTFYFEPLIEISSDPLYNSYWNTKNQLIRAIRLGTVNYVDGVFTGTFNIGISRELSRYAEFDGRSNTWKPFSTVPSDVTGAAIVANDKRRELNKALKSEINSLQDRVDQAIDGLSFTITESLAQMDTQLSKDLVNLAMLPSMTPQMIDTLSIDYTFNQQLNIKKWNPDQITRLREMVENHALDGYTKTGLREQIMREWEVSRNKAKFLARQETSLFMSKLRRERFKDAGVRKYRWSTSHDERVRPRGGTKSEKGNNHRMLDGKIFTFGDPPIVDTKTGRRAEPGEDFNCRCVAIPII